MITYEALQKLRELLGYKNVHFRRGDFRSKIATRRRLIEIMEWKISQVLVGI